MLRDQLVLLLAELCLEEQREVLDDLLMKPGVIFQLKLAIYGSEVVVKLD